MKPQRCKVLRSTNCAEDHRLLKPRKQASQCCPRGKTIPGGISVLFGPGPKTEFLLTQLFSLWLPSLSPFLPLVELWKFWKVLLPTITTSRKGWEVNLPGNSVNPRKILGHLFHLRTRTLLQEKIEASQKGFKWLKAWCFILRPSSPGRVRLPVSSGYSKPRVSHQSPAGSPEPATWGLQACDNRSHIYLHSSGLPSPPQDAWGRTLYSAPSKVICQKQYRNVTRSCIGTKLSFQEKQHGRKRLKSLLYLQKATGTWPCRWQHSA